MKAEMRPLLLDTHAAIWIVRNETLAAAAETAIDAAYRADNTIFVSAITAWEVGLLVSRNRLNIQMSPQRWFARLLGVPGVQLAELAPDVLIESSFLPGEPPRDPADRIIIATARNVGAALITRDRLILNYAEHGHVGAIAC